MKYLIDTQVLLWIITDDKRLSKKAKKIFLNSQNTILFSLASLWEIAIKISLKKLILDDGLPDFINKHIKGNAVEILDIEISHILALENLPFHHRDPFDRLIISQSITENISLVSSDKSFDLYTIKRIW